MNATVHVCTMVWHPTDRNQLVVGDVEGQIGPISKIFDNFDKGTSGSASTATRDLQDDVTVTLDDDIDDVIGVGKSHNNRILDEDEDELDIGALKARYESMTGNPSESATTAGESNRRRARTPPPPAWVPVDPQQPFVSASTPGHLEQRYMKWNNVGVIRQYNSEEENSVEVTFHDTSLHHTIHLDNAVTNYTVADLSQEALVLGAPSTEETQRLEPEGLDIQITVSCLEMLFSRLVRILNQNSMDVMECLISAPWWYINRARSTSS